MAEPDEGYPLLAGRSYAAESVFRPENLLREARRPRSGWACYHSRMWVAEVDGQPLGVVGSAVGAPFAVLVAEQLAASGPGPVIRPTGPS